MVFHALQPDCGIYILRNLHWNVRKHAVNRWNDAFHVLIDVRTYRACMRYGSVLVCCAFVACSHVFKSDPFVYQYYGQFIGFNWGDYNDS